jgi:methyl-accepting chemotaxis protein
LQQEIQTLKNQLNTAENVKAQQLSGGAMLEAIRTSLLQNASNLSDEKHSLVHMSEVFSLTRQSIEQLVQKAEVIRKDAERSVENVRLLGQSSQSVNQLISSIQEISDQTNLLALNAAVLPATLPAGALDAVAQLPAAVLDVPRYAIDAILRRSPALQATTTARAGAEA